MQQLIESYKIGAAASASIHDLIQKRKAMVRKGLYDQFAVIFANHNQVKALHPADSGLSKEELARKWTELRWQAGGNRANRQATEAVKYHLEKTVNADEETQKMIHGYWTDFNQNVKANKNIEKIKNKHKTCPEARLKHNEYQRQNAAQMMEMRRKDGWGPTFQDLVELNEMDLRGMNALEVEKATRHFYHLQRPKHQAFRQFRKYLHDLGFDEASIKAANGARKKWQENKWQIEARKRRKQRAEALHSEISNHNLMSALIGQSRWWL